MVLRRGLKIGSSKELVKLQNLDHKTQTNGNNTRREASRNVETGKRISENKINSLETNRENKRI
jgi:hypothetical protein